MLNFSCKINLYTLKDKNVFYKNVLALFTLTTASEFS